MKQIKTGYRIKELAEKFGIAAKTLYDWASQGRFPSYKPGSIVMVDINDFSAFLQVHKRKAAPIEVRVKRIMRDNRK